MSLTILSAAKRSVAILALAVVAANSVSVANAGQNKNAPVRNGNIQMASIQGIGGQPSDPDFFRYPDEPFPHEIGFAKRPAPKTKAASHMVAGYELPFVAPSDYASYVKIGRSYKVGDKIYTPEENAFYDETGMGSWYGPGFHGKKTANGEIYDMYAFTAAHPTLPLPSFVEVTNTRTGEAVVVRVNDRGPFVKDRIIDVSHAAAQRLSLLDPGSSELRVKYLAPAPKAEDLEYAPTQRPNEPVIAEARPKVQTAQMIKDTLPDHFVQMGSFTSRKNAENFSDQLLETGAQAIVVFAHVNGSKYYRVVMGPYNNRSDADTKKREMARYGFDGLVIRNP